MRKLLWNTLLILVSLPMLAVAGKYTMVTIAIMDQQGQPIDSVVCVLRSRPQNPTDKPKEYRELSDSTGAAEFDKIDEGFYDVYVEKQGFQQQQKTVRVRDQYPSNLLITLLPSNGGDGFTSKIKHFGPMDPKTARVFVAFSSLTTPTDAKTASSGSNDPTGTGADFNSLSTDPTGAPYSTPNEMGAVLYGGNPMDFGNMPKLGLPGQVDAAMASLHPNNISILDINSQQVVGWIPTSSAPLWLTFAPDGRHFWVVDQMRNLVMYSPEGDILGSLNLGDNLVTDLAVDGRGSRLFLAIRSWPNSNVLIVDGNTNAVIGHVDLPMSHGQPGGIAASADGRIVVVTMGTTTNGWLEVVDSAAGSIIKEIPVGNQPLGVGITPDGTRAVVANYSSSSVTVVDIAAGNAMNTFQTGMEPARVAMRSDGRVAFVTNNGDDTLSIVNVQTATHVAKVGVGKGPMGVAVTPDGKRVYVANHDSANVTIIDGFTLAILGSTQPSTGVQAYGVAVRP